MKKFEQPKIIATLDENNKNQVKVSIKPLEKGYGLTLGNALRRTLISSLPGASIYALEIDGVRHEFSNIDGVREDVTGIVLNLKDLILSINDEYNVTKQLKINVKGPKVVTAKDIIVPTGVEVINKDLYIATISPNAELNIIIYARNGRGYVLAEEETGDQHHFGVIKTDANYSPIKQVTYEVEKTRFLDKTNYENLILVVETNGSVSPNKAVSTAAKILNDHLKLFVGLENINEFEQIFEETKTPVVSPGEGMSIEDLDLSVRSYNCLNREGIETVQELILKTEEELAQIKNMGKKSISEIKEKIMNLGLSFKESEQRRVTNG